MSHIRRFYEPLRTAVSFIEATSDPEPVSLIANAPMCSPLHNYKKTIYDRYRKVIYIYIYTFGKYFFFSSSLAFLCI